METEVPPVASSNIATPKAGSILKEKKRKLKAVFRKRHPGLGNLSIRNSTLNSTIFKASLKVNNRALAQALERKKSECRVAEAIILQQKDEIQLLTADVNRGKMIAEKTKRTVQERLQAVSNTLHLAVDQLIEAMDACTDGEFRKLSGPLLPLATAISVSPSVNEQISLKPTSNVDVRPAAAGPSRVTVSSAASTACDDDEDQDVVASMDLSKEPPPCDGPKLTVEPCSNLSIIMEQSYLTPSETDLTLDEPELGFRHSNSRDRRNMVIFQPSLADSPAPADREHSKNEFVVRGMTRSRSRHSCDLPTGEMDKLQDLEKTDAGIRRSSSRDRRNAIIFHRLSNDSPREDTVSVGNSGRTLRRSRNSSGQFPEGGAAKIGRFEESQADTKSTKLKESVALPASQISGGDEEEEKSFLDETLVEETEVLSSELTGQMSLLQNLVKNSKIKERNSDVDSSVELIDETIVVSNDQSSCVTETLMEAVLSRLSFGDDKRLPASDASTGVPKRVEQVSESLTEDKISHGVKQIAPLPDFALAEEAQGLVNRGQFVTRDKIARTPVKVVKRLREGEEGSMEDSTVIYHNGNMSEISECELSESENRRSRSLSRRDIPTFLPIDSLNATGSTPRKSKGAAPAPKGQTKISKSLKTTGKRTDCAGPSTLAGKKSQNNPGLMSCQGINAKSGVVPAAEHSGANARMARRGTFELPNAPFLEGDIMKEDDSVLINDSFESCPATADDVFVNVDQLPKESSSATEEKETRSSKVESGYAENLGDVPSQNPVTEKNVTILMVEDMEQTGVSFAAISIIDPPGGTRQLADEETKIIGDGCRSHKVQNDNRSPEKQQTFLAEKGSKVLLPATCVESVKVKTCGKGRKVTKKDLVQQETAGSNEMEAREESAGEDVEQTSNTVRRGRIASSKLKLPGSGVAAVEKSSERDTKSRPGVACTKTGTVFDNPVLSLADHNRDVAEVESAGEENQEQSIDIETKKRFAAFLSKPGNIVFNADRKDLAGNEVPKKSRSKSRSILPLQQKPRSKASVASAKPDDGGTLSVWDFKGTPRIAAAKENAARLLSVYDISLNDSDVIPKTKDKAEPLKKRSKALKEFSKDDSFIVDKNPSAGKRRVRHESASAIRCKAPFDTESENARKEALESPHGIMLVLGNGKRKKLSARSKTVRYEVEDSGQNKAVVDQDKTSSLLSEISKDAAGSHLVLNQIDSKSESDMVPKPKPDGAETTVSCKSSKEPRTQQTDQLKLKNDKVIDDLVKDYAEEEGERISEKDFEMDSGKNKVDGVSRLVKVLKNRESENCKEISQRNQKTLGTVRNNDDAVSVKDKNAARNVKGSDAGKGGKNSNSSKGRGDVNPRKEIKKGGSNSTKDRKNLDSKGGSDFSPFGEASVGSSNTASSQDLTNTDNDQATVLSADKEKGSVKQASGSDKAGKSVADAAALPDSLRRSELNELGMAVAGQKKLAALHIGNAKHRDEAESPREVAVQRRARKRRAIRSTDLFEDIDTESLPSPKFKQPALAKAEEHPVTSRGTMKAQLRADNHHQDDGPAATNHSQSGGDLPKPPVPGNARRDHNSLRLRKNPKATSAKASENGDIAEPIKAVSPELVSEQPLGMSQKMADTKKTSSEKESADAAPRQRPNLSTKKVKGRTGQRNSNVPNEECASASSDTPQADISLTESHKDLDLQEGRGNEDKSKKKHSIIQNRQSSVSTGSCDTSSHADMVDRRTRRTAAQAVSYKEPSLGKKLRRGDPHTSTIYGGANQELVKHLDSERTSDARLSRKVLSTVENTLMEAE